MKVILTTITVLALACSAIAQVHQNHEKISNERNIVRTHKEHFVKPQMERQNVLRDRNITRKTTTVNVNEFRSRHSEMFRLGRHPVQFFQTRFGESHVRLIDNEYFAFVDGCWVAIDVDGFAYAERVICQGDPDYIVVD